jgi:hypothetical protein
MNSDSMVVEANGTGRELSALDALTGVAMTRRIHISALEDARHPIHDTV